MLVCAGRVFRSERNDSLPSVPSANFRFDSNFWPVCFGSGKRRTLALSLQVLLPILIRASRRPGRWHGCTTHDTRGEDT